MTIRAEHRAWIRTHGAGAHEAAAASAGSAGSDPSEPKPTTGGNSLAEGEGIRASGGSSNRVRAPGVFGGGDGVEGAVDGGGAGGGGMYAYGQHTRDQWQAAYYHQQQQQVGGVYRY